MLKVEYIFLPFTYILLTLIFFIVLDEAFPEITIDLVCPITIVWRNELMDVKFRSLFMVLSNLPILLHWLTDSKYLHL
jgi:hypothetical protein